MCSCVILGRDTGGAEQCNLVLKQWIIIHKGKVKELLCLCWMLYSAESSPVMLSVWRSSVITTMTWGVWKRGVSGYIASGDTQHTCPGHISTSLSVRREDSDSQPQQMKKQCVPENITWKFLHVVKHPSSVGCKMRVELDSSLQTNIEVEMSPGQVCGPALDTKRKMKSFVCRDEQQLRRDW